MCCCAKYITALNIRSKLIVVHLNHMRNTECKLMILNNTPYLEAGQVFHKLNALEMRENGDYLAGCLSIDELLRDYSVPFTL